jgi:hypothetical protein
MKAPSIFDIRPMAGYMILGVCLLVVGVQGYFLFNDDCWTEKRVVLDQRIGSSFQVDPGCEDCLVMDLAKLEKTSFLRLENNQSLRDSDLETLNGMSKTYFFQFEDSLREDIQAPEIVQVKYCDPEDAEKTIKEVNPVD